MPRARLRTACAALVLAVCSFYAGADNGHGSPLSGDEIRTLVVGNTVRGPWRARPYAWSFTTDGRIFGDVGANTVSGTWRISDDGIYCHEFTDFLEGVERCYQWYAMPDYSKGKGRYVMKNVDAFRIRDLHVWQIEPGLD